MPFSTVFPATRIPNWFKHRRKGHAIRIKASPNWYSNNFLGFAVSAVMHIGDSSSTYCNLDSHDHNSESGSIAYIPSLMITRANLNLQEVIIYGWLIYHQFSALIMRNGVELTIHSMQTTGSA